MAHRVSSTATGKAEPFDVSVPGGMYRFLRAIAHGINRAYWRVTVEGAERVPATGPVIVTPVHRSFMDFFVASEVTKRKICYMAKEELWKSPRFGRLLESLGAFPVNRSGTDRLAIERAQQVLERGDLLVLFPEGTRRTGPVVQDLLEGAPFLAMRTGASIVPVGIGGTEAAMPKGSKVVRPVKVHVVVGEPIVPPPRSGKGRVSRHQVRELTDALHLELQQLFDLAQARVDDRRRR